MTQSAAGRIQSREAQQSGGTVAKDGFAARAQRAADRHVRDGKNGK